MTVLLAVPAHTAERLVALCAEDVPNDVQEDIRAGLQSVPLAHATPADPSARTSVPVPHDMLVRVARWARPHQRSDLSLDALLRGAQLYIPPRPKYQRVRTPRTDAATRTRRAARRNPARARAARVRGDD